MTAAKYSAPPSSTLVTTVLVPRTSPSRNPRTATSSVRFRSMKPTPRVRMPPKPFTSGPSSSASPEGRTERGRRPPFGRGGSLLLRGDASPHHREGHEPGGHERERGGQSKRGAAGVRQVIRRSAGRGAGSGARGRAGRGAGARGGSRTARGVVLREEDLQAVGVDGANGEGAVDSPVGERDVGHRQDRVFCPGGVDVEGVGPFGHLRVGRGVGEGRSEE